jgi:hypothetical protein
MLRGDAGRPHRCCWCERPPARGFACLAQEWRFEVRNALAIVKRDLGENSVRLTRTARPSDADVDRAIRLVGFTGRCVELPLPRIRDVAVLEEDLGLVFGTACLFRQRETALKRPHTPGRAGL